MSLGAVQTEGYSFDRNLILSELERTLAAVSEPEIAAAQRMILTANRLFVMGAGRTGLALKMAAMRLMHLGLVVYVAGEVTTPAIGQGDLLLGSFRVGHDGWPGACGRGCREGRCESFGAHGVAGFQTGHARARRGRDSGSGQAGSSRSHL